MDRQSIITYKESFDTIATYITGDDGNEQVEVWFARDLQSVLGYTRWENFQTAIGRAVDSCKSLNVSVDDHFREVTKMISLAKGAQREIQDYMLTRYACYLIAQNGDPKFVLMEHTLTVFLTSSILFLLRIEAYMGITK